MELKIYQKIVLNDLCRFLALLTEKQSIRQAYNLLWEEKGVQIGETGMSHYNMVLHGVPHVCFKVPTGGGKTFLAASSIKPIFDSMPHIHPMAVVWLVPSDAILNQTVAALQNVEHPYRRRINADFPGNVEVYTKEQMLNGQKFNPASVDEQLSIFVLSYDSFRTNKKEGRKAYQENGYLAAFKDYKTEQALLLKDTDETALIQVIRKLNPVIIVDESHHATSKLSIEMLENFNPSFVLDLTATPKEGSNIISFVDAKQLKGEEMIKLPVIVYNRRTQDDVFISAISLRQKLENEAKKEEAQTGKYIRPIVLFQAEAKNQQDSTTYEKVKKALLEIGVPEEQIAIKTADRDELRNQNLLAKDCKVRYIITVNALKEGWDCSFAYILATVANRSSVVDVEQMTDLEQLYYPYMSAIEKKVNRLLDEYAASQFDKLLEQEHITCESMYHLANSIAPAKTISSIPKSLYVEEEQFDNEYEKKVVWELSALENIKWWHRNIARKGFAINGAVNAYPDLIAMTNSGKILMIETKGDQLKNDESKIKSETGAKWAAKASMAGRLYKYYMVFQTKNPDYEGAYSHERFMEIVREL